MDYDSQQLTLLPADFESSVEFLSTDVSMRVEAESPSVLFNLEVSED